MRGVRYILTVFAFFFFHAGQSQVSEPYVRIARIVVDSSQLDSYLSFLREGIDMAVKVEQGVLRMYAVQDKMNPSHVTVFETYASKAAYDDHIKTPHFKKYKTGTMDMVKSLELIDVIPVIFRAKKDE